MSASTFPFQLTFTPLAESALLVRVGDGEEIEAGVVDAVGALTRLIDQEAVPGVFDVVPAYSTILISFDPEVTEGDAIESLVRDLAQTCTDATGDEPRTVIIPVAYGGPFGPDLPEVAASLALAPDEVVALHAGAEYRVAFMGFSPGWAYLMGTPPELAVGRRAEPRTRVPAGSVSMGGGQTGVYPSESPGGWHLIGRTPVDMFDPARTDPFLLRPGDRVRFAPIDGERFAAMRGRHGEIGGDQAFVRVREPGLLTTVQDLGRPGQARFGVPPGGALDRRALILGNRLLGNEPGAAALEITLTGPVLEFDGPIVLAITGADLGARLNGQVVPLWEPFRIVSGDVLRFDPGASPLGARAYLCLAGGIDVEPVLGGRSTDLLGRFGGWQGRAIAAGDVLPIGVPPLADEVTLRRRLMAAPPVLSHNLLARVTAGPQWERFSEQAQSTFLSDAYKVTPKSNRQGIRMRGAPLEHVRGADIVSEGISLGAVQVPGDGQPIVLLAARQTVGGYTKIATVIGADVDAFGQLRPGDGIEFSLVSVDDARAAFLTYQASFRPDAIIEHKGGFRGSSAGTSAIEEVLERVSGAWDPEGVMRVIAALETAGVTSFSIDDARTGFKLEVQRGELIPATSHAETDANTPSEADIYISAPVLGVFYRQSAPEQPPLVEAEQHIDVGQVIGVIEVMKSYHEVTATISGVLAEFLVEDGQFVEYGQPIARLEREAQSPLLSLRG